MPNFGSIRLRTAAIGLLVLLMISATLAGAWHKHHGGADTNCYLCHVSHQPVEPVEAASEKPLFVISGLHQETPALPSIGSPAIRSVPARAPPEA